MSSKQITAAKSFILVVSNGIGNSNRWFGGKSEISPYGHKLLVNDSRHWRFHNVWIILFILAFAKSLCLISSSRVVMWISFRMFAINAFVMRLLRVLDNICVWSILANPLPTCNRSFVYMSSTGGTFISTFNDPVCGL